MGISLAIILGSGIEIDSERIENIRVLDEDEFGIHKKVKFICSFEGHELLAIQGRKHFYEGHNFDQLTNDIKFIREYGVGNLMITNAAGGVNDNYYVTDLMLIRSFVNLNNSLIHAKRAFPYDSVLMELFRKSCMKSGTTLHEGVYAYHQGPNYETKSEIRFQKKYYFDAAGMSTVPESIDANLSGIKVLALSVITNILKENFSEPASHESVIANAKAASANLNKALSAFVTQLN